MPKALLLGANGLLGQALSKVLPFRGWDLLPLTRSNGDFCDWKFLEKTLSRSRPDVVFNAAAWTAVDNAEDDPESAWLLNRDLPEKLARLIYELPDARLVHYGTDFIFSGSGHIPKTETDKPAPESVYGSSKLAGEIAALEILGKRALVIRTAWLFGPGRKNFVNTILDAAQTRDELKVVCDQTGSPTYAPDLADWSERLVRTAASGVFHGVNSGQASWHELACEALRLAGSKCGALPIPSEEWPQKAKRPLYSVLSNEKLASRISLKPRHWKDALREHVKARFCA